MLTHLQQSTLQMDIKKAMKLLSNCFPGYLAQAQCLRQPRAFHRGISEGFCKEPTFPCHQPSPSCQEMGPRQNHCLLPRVREILFHSGPSWKLKYVLPVLWLELLRKTSATSKLITEHKHPSLRPGLLWERLDAGSEIGCCRRWGRPS